MTCCHFIPFAILANDSALTLELSELALGTFKSSILDQTKYAPTPITKEAAKASVARFITVHFSRPNYTRYAFSSNSATC
jgi:hypothetical protein